MKGEEQNCVWSLRIWKSSKDAHRAQVLLIAVFQKGFEPYYNQTWGVL